MSLSSQTEKCENGVFYWRMYFAVQNTCGHFDGHFVNDCLNEQKRAINKPSINLLQIMVIILL